MIEKFKMGDLVRLVHTKYTSSRNCIEMYHYRSTDRRYMGVSYFKEGDVGIVFGSIDIENFCEEYGDATLDGVETVIVVLGGTLYKACSEELELV